MKQQHFLWRLLLVCFGMIGMAWQANAQLSYFDITAANGKFAFAYNQVPDNLVPVNATIVSSFGYQWEQSTTPIDGFTPISGATSANYTFSAPLSQTTYFRRKFFLTATVGFYSNVVKVEVVSVNWENLNYVRQHDVLVPGATSWQTVDQLPIGDKLQVTTYLDGMGRDIQKVGKEMSTPDPTQPNTWKDLVQFSKYDAFGRKTQTFLPYTTTTEAGKYKSAPLTEQPQYYAAVYNETSAFNSATFDNSPLNRIIGAKRSGTSWAAGTGSTLHNDMNTAADDVQIFTIGYTPGSTPLRTGVYPEYSLYKTIDTDEAGRLEIKYTNKHGQLILTKTQVADNPSASYDGWVCVYNIYDDFGSVRYVIQPEGVKWLSGNGWSFAGTDGQKVLNEFCFRYEYDEKRRGVVKKAPGTDEVYAIYDWRDRPVFTQDGAQRTKSPKEWTAVLYDDLDREVMVALYNTNKSVTDLQTDINNSVSYSTVTVTNPAAPLDNLVLNNRQSSVSAYLARSSIEFISDANGEFESLANDEFIAEIDPSVVSPTVTVSVVTYNNPISPADLNNSAVTTIVKYLFYDNYSFSNVKQFYSGFDNALAYSTSEPIASTQRSINMFTGSAVRILGTSTFLYNTFYYDETGRPIQTLEDNIKSGVDIATFQYKFDGRLLSVNSKHSAANTGYHYFSIVSKNIFDKIGRLAGIDKKIGSAAFKNIVSYEYDDVGRLKKKRLSPGYTGTGKNELESLSYSYDLHNKITGINKDYALKTPGLYNKWDNFFGIYLGYDNRDAVFANANLTGEITGVLWTTQGDDAQRKYDYTYDKGGRLINALFNEKQSLSGSWSNAKMDFSITGRNNKIEYDLNGNLLYMLHKGVVPGGYSTVVVDDIQYYYASLSNKLLKVSDNSTLGLANGKLGDLADGTNSGDDYDYDKNGNLVLDLNKNAKDLNNTPGTNGIKYNFLNKPEEIRIAGKGTIKLVYDANGNKLQKLFTPEGSSNSISTTYIEGYIYQGDQMQYISFEEGRLRIVQATSQTNGYDHLSLDGNIDMPNGKRGAFDYLIRDYLGNVRMILTEETHLGANICTMEMQRAANEELVFGQVDANGNPATNNEVAARFAVANIPGQSSGNGWQNNTIGNHVSRVGSLASSKIGPNTLLKVMAGDKVSATTIYYYKNPVVNQGAGTSSLVINLLFSLVNAISTSPVAPEITKAAAYDVTSQLDLSSFSSIVNPDDANTSGNNPKAYLTVLFFDERFNFVQEGSTYMRVQQAGNGAPALVLANIKAPKNGYAYVYVGNQSEEMVYFDNLQVSHERGRIVEENHYYAYGLKIAAISSRKIADPNEGHVLNKNLYNDKELIEEADLNWYDYGFRNYDPQTGRFVQQDPLQDAFPFWTPFQYAGNEPIANIDIDGMEAGGVTVATTAAAAKVLEEVFVVGYRTVSTVASTFSTVTRVTSLVFNTTAIFANAAASAIQTTQIGNQQPPDYWILYQGTKVIIYKGPYNDVQNSTVYKSYPGTSGEPGYQDPTPTNLRTPDMGPIPEGDFSIDLTKSFTREVVTFDTDFKTKAGWGVQLLPWGNGGVYSGWGLWRARLKKVNVNSPRDHFYFHDSYKGESSGCIETETELYYDLYKFKKAGMPEIKVKVDYPGGATTTNGGTLRDPRPWQVDIYTAPDGSVWPLAEPGRFPNRSRLNP